MNRCIRRPLATLVAVSLAALLQDAAKAQSPVVRTIGDREHVAVLEMEGAYDRQPNDPGQNEIGVRQAVASEFLRTHPDDYDFLVVFTRFPFSLGVDDGGVDVRGRYYGIRNDVQGIGLPRFDHGAEWGSAGRLQGYIDMGALSRLATLPTDPGFEETLSVLAHEMGHRWLSHARFRDASGSTSNALLGREGSHWSFLLHSGNSVMYGNEWQDNGDGTFTSVGRRRTFYSPLDLYLMGLRPASEVPPFVLLENPSEQADRLPESGVTIAATPRTVTIEDVIAAEAERIPSVDEAPKRFKVGFVLLVRPGDAADESDIGAINTIRDAFATRMVILTGAKAIVDVYPGAARPEIVAPPPVLPPSSGPRTTPVDLGQALSWLIARQQTDGRWGDTRWTAARDTATVLELLGTISGATVARDRALAWFAGLGVSPNVDTAARRSLALGGPTALDDIAVLRGAANASGGWGLARGYQSDPLDTALALLAAASQEPARDVAYLVESQNSDGGWGLRAAGPSAISSTVTVLSLRNRYETPQFAAALERATIWLHSRQRMDGGFGDEASDPADTARAVLYLAGTTFPRAQLDAALDYLRASQLNDGSWRESVHDTALAVQALQFAELPNAAVIAAGLTVTPSNPVEGQPATITAEIANLGPAPLPGSVMRVFDGEPSLGRQIGESVVAPLNGFARTTVSLVWDTSARAGDHVLYLVLDPGNEIAESNEADNIASRNIRVRAPDAGIDLAVAPADIVLSPDRLVAVPQSQSVAATIWNLGRSDATQATVSLYDGNPDASGVKLVDRVVNVPAGRSTTVTFTFEEQASGDHLYFVAIDPIGVLTEGDRTNNRASALLRAAAVVDLAIEPGSPTFSANPIAIGRDLTISAVVANHGTTAVFNVPVRFSIDDPAGRLALGSRTVDLQPGETRELSVTWRAARAFTGAPVVVEINPDNLITETSTGNNRATAALTVMPSTLPNLRVATGDLRVSTPLDAGGRGEVALDVHNDGAVAAQNVLVRFFAGDPASGGTPIAGPHVIPAVAAGATATAVVVWDPIGPAGLTPIVAVVDPDNAVAEFAEDDNRAFITASLRSLPDLAVVSASIRFTPAFPRDGEPVTIATTVINSGEQTARDVIVRFFDGNPGAGGVQIGPDRLVGEVAGGAQGTAEVIFTQAVPGVRDIYVQVDPDGRVVEQREDNNVATRRLGVQDASLWATNLYFSPNGDGVQDTTELFFRLGDDRRVSAVDLENRRGDVVRTFDLSSAEPLAAGSLSWDGRDPGGRVVADGEYTFRLKTLAGTVVASAIVVVDNNASSISDAIGTEFFFNTNLTCQAAGPPGPAGNGLVTDFRNKGGAGWLADDSGLVQWIRTQAPCRLSDGTACRPEFTDSQTGVYVSAPGGEAPRRITPDSWTMVPPEGQGTEILDATVAPSGNRIAITVARYVVESGAKRYVNPVEFWVINGDGSDLTLAGTSHEDVGFPFSITAYPVVFSPDGERLLFVSNMRDPAVPERILDSSLVAANLADGTQNTLATYAGSSAGVFGAPVNAYEWMADGGHILFQIYQEDSVADPEQRAVTQYHVVRADGSGRRLLFSGDYSWRETPFVLGPDRVAVIGNLGPDGRFTSSSASRYVLPLWLFPIAGGPPTMAAPDVERQFVTVSPDRRYLAFSDSQTLTETDDYDPHGTGVWLVDANGRIEQLFAATLRNRGLWPVADGSAGAWSVDGTLLAFEQLSTSDQVDAPTTVVLMDVQARSIRAVDLPASFVRVFGFFPDGRTLLTQSPYHALDTVTGTATALPIESDVPVLGFSASGRYLLYRSGLESRNPSGACWAGYPRENEWALASMLNLSADLSFARDGAQIVVRGTAQDLNFLQYRLEYAPVESPTAWAPIDEPSDRAVVNDVLARWIPPYEGAFYVRLIVADRAGNTTGVRRRVTWGLTPAITNLTSSPAIFSPNGDGASDALTINYAVTAPIALEFTVFDAGNHPVRTIRQDHSSIGAASIAWDGRNDAGGYVGDGLYRVHVREYDLYVTVDTTPPDLSVSIGPGLHSEVASNCGAVGGGGSTLVVCQSGSTQTIARPYWVVTGHVDDANLVSRRLEAGAGVNPAEWTLLAEGTTRQAVLDVQGNIKRPIEDVTLHTIRSVAEVSGTRVRLTATDRAGNRTTRVSDFAPEEIIAFAWDGKAIPVNEAVEQKPGAHTISIQHTIRAPVQRLTIQYRLVGTEAWTDGPSVNAMPPGTELPFDTTALLPGRTYDIRVVAGNAGAVLYASNPFTVHSNRFELTRIVGSDAFGIESLREPLREIRLVLAQAGDEDMGTGPVEPGEPPTFVARMGTRPAELCRAGWPSVPVRFKGIAQSGTVYYSNTSAIACGTHPPTPIGGVLDLRATPVLADTCGDSSPQEVLITASVRDTGGLVSGSETLAIQEVPNGPLRPVTDARFPLNLRLSTAGRPEGVYTVRATARVRVPGAAGRIEEQEIARTTTFVVDTHAPDASITFPVAGQAFCPVPRDGRIFISVNGIANDANFERYELESGVGDAPSLWSRIPPASVATGGSRQLPVPHGLLADWDVTGVPGGTHALRLKVWDRGGNVSCHQVSVQVASGVDLGTPTPNRRLFSPNGDEVLDDVTVTYSLSQAARVTARVFAAGADQPSDSPVRTLLANAQQLAGPRTLVWDGHGDGGLRVEDGEYVVVLAAVDACGITREARTRVTVDATAPDTLIDVAASEPFGVLADIRGTASDTHFSDFRLEVGTGDAPVTWSLLSSETVPVQTGLLGKWLTRTAGVHSLRLTAADEAGNRSESRAVVTLGDRPNLVTDVAVAPFVFSPNADDRLDFAAIHYTLGARARALVEVLDSAGATVTTLADTTGVASRPYTVLWDGRGSADEVVADGDYVVRITAISESDPASTQIERTTVRVDTTPPAIALDSPGEGMQLAGDVEVRGSVTDANLERFTVAYAAASGGAPVTLADEPRSRTNTAFGTIVQPADGLYAATITALDRAQNSQSLTHSFVVDGSAPTVSLFVPENGVAVGGPPAAVEIRGTITAPHLHDWVLRYAANGVDPPVWSTIATGAALPASDVLAVWPVGVIADGSYMLSLVGTNLAGATSEARVAITVDNTRPTAAITAPVSGARITGPTPIAGTAFDANFRSARLELSSGDAQSAFEYVTLAALAEPVEGGPLFVLRSLPRDGTYTLRLTVEDRAGFTATTTATVVVAAHPPQPATNLVGAVEGRDAARLAWQPSPDPAAAVAGYHVYRNTQRITAAPIAATSFIDANLPGSVHRYTVTAVNLDGVESSQSNEVLVSIDLTPPTTSLHAPLSGASVNGLLDVRGTATSSDFREYRVLVGIPGSSLTMIRQSPAPVTAGALAQYDTATLADGAGLVIRLESEDLIGNVGVHEIVVTVDNVLPPTPILLSAAATGSRVDVQWQAAPADVAGYLLYDNGVLANADRIVSNVMSYLLTGTAFSDLAVPDGTHAYYVVAVDAAGNASAPSNTLTVEIETRPPRAAIVRPASGARIEQSIELLAATPDLDVRQVQFEVRTSEAGPWTARGGPVLTAPFTITWNPAGLPFGSYQFRAVATDVRGNTDPAPPVISVSFQELLPPAAPSGVSARVTGANAVVSWAANAESDLRGYVVYRRTETTSGVNVSGLITTTTFTDSDLADGRYTYTVAAVDRSDNESGLSAGVAAHVYAPSVSVFAACAAEPTSPVSGNRADPGSLVTAFVSVGGDPIASATTTAAGDGTFRFESLPLAAGENVVWVQARDVAGNTSRPSPTVSVSYVHVDAVNGFTATAIESGVLLGWDALPGTVAGYNVYRGVRQLNGSPLSGSMFTDRAPGASSQTYYVAAVNPCGAEGVRTAATVQLPPDHRAPDSPSPGYPTVPDRPRSMAVTSTPVSGMAEPGAKVTVLQDGLSKGSATALVNPSVEAFTLAVRPAAEATVFGPHALLGTFVRRPTDTQPVLLTTDVVSRATRYYDQLVADTAPVFSPDGNRVTVVSQVEDAYRLVTLDRRAGTVSSVVLPAWSQYPAFSPDGTRVAFVANGEVWIAPVSSGGTPVAITSGAWSAYPVWSPDGRRIAYVDGSTEHTTLRLIDVATRATTDIDPEANWSRPGFAPDGTTIVFSSRRGGDDDIWLYDVASGTVRSVAEELSAAAQRSDAAFALDGSALAYLRLSADFSSYALVIRSLATGAVEEFATDEFWNAPFFWLGDGSVVQLAGENVRRYRPTGHFQVNGVLLDQGTNALVATATDASNNESGPSAPIVLTRETAGLPDLEIAAADLFVYPTYAPPGTPIWISATVRNTGDAPAHDVLVRFMQSGTDGVPDVIASRTIPVVNAGAELLVNIAWQSPAAPDRRTVTAIVDPLNTIDELDETNNGASRGVVLAAGEEPIVRAATDRTSYPPTGSVAVSAEVSNPGPPADFVMEVRVEDEHGVAVTTLDRRVLTAFGYDSRAFAGNWSATGVLAGRYRVHAMLTRADGVVFDALAAFAVESGENVSASVTTDRASYAPGQQVVVRGRVRNVGLNVDLNELNASIRIVNASGTEVTRTDTPIATLLTGMESQVLATWVATAAGAYTVELTVHSGGAQRAAAGNAFEIRGAANIVGTVTATPGRALLGARTLISATTRNTGTVDAQGVRLRLLVLDAARRIVRSHERVLDLTAGNAVTWDVEETTAGLPLQSYSVLLQHVAAGEDTLSTTTLTVVDGVAPVIRVTSPAAGSHHRSNVTVEVLASDDASGVERLEFSMDDGGVALLPVQDAAAGRYGLVYPASVATEGRRRLQVRGFDRAGNGPATSSSDANPLTIEFVIDITPPTIDVSGVEDGARYDAPVAPSVATSDLSEVTTRITLDGAPFVSGTVVTDGGQHVLEVHAADEAGNEAARVVRFTLDFNRPPVAGNLEVETARDQPVAIVLPASDPDGNAMGFEVTQPLHGALTGSAPSLTYVPDPGFVGSDSFNYTVSDGALTSGPATVSIVVSAVNRAPVADAGPDRNIAVGTSVTLDGTGSHDADGDLIAYRWRLSSRPAGSAVDQGSLSDPASPSVSFTPDVAGAYTLELIVHDGVVDSAPDTVDVVAHVANVRPNADAGRDQQVILGSSVTVNGSRSSDPDDGPQPLAYEWIVVSTPAQSQVTSASLSSPFAAETTFYPDVAGEFVLELTVSDGESEARARTRITVAENTPPVASAGTDVTIPLGAAATLDGSASSDADGGPEPLSYRWSFVSVPAGSALTNASLTGATAATARFVPDAAGVFVVSLTVSDGAFSASDNVAITVTGTTAHVYGGAYFFHNGYQEKLSLDVTVTSNLVGAGSWLRYYYTRTRTDLSSTKIESVTRDGQAVTVSGLATVNGVPGYRFMAVVQDGAPDAFRMRILRPDGTLFYDYGGTIEGGDLVIESSP